MTPSIKHALDRMAKALATYQPPEKAKLEKKAKKQKG